LHEQSKQRGDANERLLSEVSGLRNENSILKTDLALRGNALEIISKTLGGLGGLFDNDATNDIAIMDRVSPFKAYPRFPEGFSATLSADDIAKYSSNMLRSLKLIADNPEIADPEAGYSVEESAAKGAAHDASLVPYRGKKTNQSCEILEPVYCELQSLAKNHITGEELHKIHDNLEPILSAMDSHVKIHWGKRTEKQFDGNMYFTTGSIETVPDSRAKKLSGYIHEVMEKGFVDKHDADKLHDLLIYAAEPGWKPAPKIADNRPVERTPANN
jgi:hypothetical protein